MDGINTWCRLVVYVSVISAAVMLTVPEGSIKKVYRTLMTVMMIFSLLYSPGSGEGITLNPDELFSAYERNEINSELDSYKNIAIINSAQTEAEKYINEKLKAAGVSAVCNVICSVGKDAVYISKVTVETNDDEPDTELILSVIRELCVKESLIIINGEKYE